MDGSAGVPVREGGPGISGWLWEQSVRDFEVTPLLQARAAARRNWWWIGSATALCAMMVVGVNLWTEFIGPQLALSLAALAGGCLALVSAIVATLWSQTRADLEIARSWQQSWTPVPPAGVVTVMNSVYLVIVAVAYAAGVLAGGVGVVVLEEGHDRALALGYVICLLVLAAVGMIPATEASRRPAIGADPHSLFADRVLRHYEIVPYRLVLAFGVPLLWLLARAGGTDDSEYGLVLYLLNIPAFGAGFAASLANPVLGRAPAPTRGV